MPNLIFIHEKSTELVLLITPVINNRKIHIWKIGYLFIKLDGWIIEFEVMDKNGGIKITFNKLFMSYHDK